MIPRKSGIYYLIAGTGLALILLNGCANVGTPTGGLKDYTPPVYVEGEPENKTVDFKGEEISITFDEYIQLKDQNKELMISPPLKKRPDIRIRDKSIRIRLNNELLPQTTYTINFGNAISDVNEENLLPDFEFVFSTGNSIDSLSVTGKVLNAFNKQPADEKDESVLVMLYENLADSAPLVEIPRYIGKTSKSGLFSINNVRADTFRILALKDANNNLMYDPGLESVAFLDSFLIINAGNVKPVTFIKDTVKIISPETRAGRSAKKSAPQPADTTIAPGKKLNAVNVSLFYFLEETNKVFLDTKNRETRGKLFFTFNRPPLDTAKLAPLNFGSEKEWYIKESSRFGDTLTYWITDSLIAGRDTLKLTMTYLTTDSVQRFVERTDTFALRFLVKTESGAGSRRKQEPGPAVRKEVLALTASIARRGIQNLNQPIIIKAEKPLGTLNADSIKFFRLKDSLTFEQPFTILRDSFNLRNFVIKTTWEEDTQYELLLKPGVSSDIYGVTNDSVEIGFTTQKSDYYGRILLTLGSAQFPIMVQLMDEKGVVVANKYLTKPGMAIFDFLPPKKYSIKAIYDRNENRKWDTGNYLKHVQPEQVHFYNMSKELRSNWDYEINWVLSD